LPQLKKRALDVVLSTLILLLIFPLLLTTYLILSANRKQPAFFRQSRTGLGGAPFRIIKFRTMSVLDDGDVVDQAVRNDLRVTRFGSLLRRTSVDELPQLINVLKGEMSLVGPRPHALAHDKKFGEIHPNYHNRFAAKPGITGLAQLRGHRGPILSDRDLADRIEADLHYIESWSLLADCHIIWRSSRLVFQSHGF
jgi:putative colanic acid biosynthesis UDP-glucose lipid carrier transferase